MTSTFLKLSTDFNSQLSKHADNQNELCYFLPSVDIDSHTMLLLEKHIKRKTVDSRAGQGTL